MSKSKTALKPDAVLKNYWKDKSTIMEHREYAKSIISSRDNI